MLCQEGPISAAGYFSVDKGKFRDSKLVRIVSETDQNIKKCSRVYILAVIDDLISQMGQFELKSFFAGGGGLFSWK